MSDAVVYALLWLSFGVLHSLLARPQFKQKLDGLLGYRYRIAYNLFAAVHIGLVLLIGLLLYRDAAPFQLPAWLMAVSYGGIAIGVVVVLASLKQYDLGLFSGTHQWRNKITFKDELTSPESLNISGLNSYIRHPLYLGLFLALWGNATSSFGLMTAFWGTVYVVIGTVFEERQLVRLYGESYKRYQSLVPVYFPWKGRVIDKLN